MTTALRRTSVKSEATSSKYLPAITSDERVPLRLQLELHLLHNKLRSLSGRFAQSSQVAKPSMVKCRMCQSGGASLHPNEIRARIFCPCHAISNRMIVTRMLIKWVEPCLRWMRPVLESSCSSKVKDFSNSLNIYKLASMSPIFFYES